MGTKEKEESTQMGAMQADKARRVTTSQSQLEPLNKTDFPPAASTQLPFLSFPFLSEKKKKNNKNKKNKLQ